MSLRGIASGKFLGGQSASCFILGCHQGSLDISLGFSAWCIPWWSPLSRLVSGSMIACRCAFWSAFLYGLVLSLWVLFLGYLLVKFSTWQMMASWLGTSRVVKVIFVTRCRRLPIGTLRALILMMTLNLPPPPHYDISTRGAGFLQFGPRVSVTFRHDPGGLKLDWVFSPTL